MRINYWALFCGVILIPSFILAAIGAAGPQFHIWTYGDPNGVGDCNLQAYLYQTKTSCDNLPTITDKYHRSNFSCTDEYNLFKSAFAFAIAAAILAFLASAFGFLSAFVPVIPTLVMSIVLFVMLMVISAAFSITLSIYHQGLCGSMSYDEEGYSLDWGMHCLIAAWVIAMVASLSGLVVCIAQQFMQCYRNSKR